MYKKRSGYGPAADKLLGYVEEDGGRSRNETTTPLLKERVVVTLENGKSFDETYVRRSHAERDITEAEISARMSTIVYMTLFVVAPLAALAVAFYQQAH